MAVTNNSLQRFERQALFSVYYGELKSYLSYYIYWHNAWRLLPENFEKPIVEPDIFLGLVYQFMRAEGKDRDALQIFAELSLVHTIEANKSLKRFAQENLFGIKPEDLFENDRWFVADVMHTLEELPPALRAVVEKLPGHMRSYKGQELAEGIASSIERRLAFMREMLRMAK